MPSDGNFTLDELRQDVRPATKDPIRYLDEEKAAPSSSGKEADTLSFDAQLLLAEIARNPCQNQSDLAQAAGISNKRVGKLQDHLAQHGYVEIQRIRIRSREGNKGKFAKLTDQGKAYVGQQLKRKPTSIHGGLAHHCGIVELKKVYEPHYPTIRMDGEVQGYRPDLYCENADHAGIVELVHSEHAKTDITKVMNMLPSVDFAHVYFDDEEVKTRYEKQLHDTVDVTIKTKVTLGMYDDAIQ